MGPFDFRRILGKLLLAALVMVVSSAAHGQCVPGWQPGDGVPGVDGIVNAMIMWDPDGPGPLTPVLVVAGSFTVAGNIAANQIATWDPATGAWGTLGNGMSNSVMALAVMPNGDLVAGGTFTYAGTGLANRIARWNGSAWSPLGSGMDSAVRALAVMNNGDLVAGGDFFTAGGNSADSIARWDGTSWSQFGGGSGGPIYALLKLASGDIVAGGTFTTIGGGAPRNRIARWDGATWNALGTGLGGPVYSLTTTNGTDVIAGGGFNTAGGGNALNVARWSGTAWAPMGSGLGSIVVSLTVLPGGVVVAGGEFSAPDVAIARWNGSSWAGAFQGGATLAYLGQPRRASAVALLPNGDLVAGGVFRQLGPTGVLGIGRWDGATWKRMSNVGWNGWPTLMRTLPNGDVIALSAAGNIGADFTIAGGTQVSNKMARFDGNTWQPFGGTLESGNIRDLVGATNGDVIAIGDFSSIGISGPVARWNGTVWAAVGTGLAGTPQSITVRPNGNIVVGGTNLTISGDVAGVASFDGVSWTALGTVPRPLVVTRTNGDLISGSQRWTGNQWAPFQTGLSFQFVQNILPMSNGDLVFAGSMAIESPPSAGALARWNGTSSTIFGGNLCCSSSQIRTLVERPNGDVVILGNFTSLGGLALGNIARWNGIAWDSMSGGIPGAQVMTALAARPDGSVLVGGLFSMAGTQKSPYFAIWRGPCGCGIADVAGLGGNPGSDGVLTPDDIVYYLAQFFANNLAVADLVGLGGSGGPDGAITPDDLVAFLAAFFTSCP